LSNDYGYGWTFDLVPEATVDATMAGVFQAMVGAAPPGWPARALKAVKVRIKRFADKLEV